MQGVTNLFLLVPSCSSMKNQLWSYQLMQVVTKSPNMFLLMQSVTKSKLVSLDARCDKESKPVSLDDQPGRDSDDVAPC